MVYKTRIDPNGPTRQVGNRSALKQCTFVVAEHLEGGRVIVESPLEALLLKLLDLSPITVELKYQPFTYDIATDCILFTDAQLKRHRQKLRESGKLGTLYTPDIQVTRQVNGFRVAEVIEAKDSDWVPIEDTDYANKLTSTADFLSQQGIEFSIYEASNRGLGRSALSSNVSRLHCTKLQRQDAMGTLSDGYLEYLHHKDALLDFLLNEMSASTSELASRFGIHPTTTWHLLIDDHVSVDLTEGSLGLSTQLYSKCNQNIVLSSFDAALLRMKSAVRRISHV